MKNKIVFSNNLTEFIFFIQLCMLFFLPPLDGEINTGRIFVYSLFGLLSFFMVLCHIHRVFLDKKIQVDSTFIWVISFYVLCFIGGIWALVKGNSISNVIRGILPFLWYIYILVLKHNSEESFMKECIHLIAIVGVIYSLRIVIYYLVFVLGNPYERVTFHLVQSTSIIPIFASVIWEYYFLVENNHKWFSFFLSFFCYIAVILTQTKSMLIAIVVGNVFLGSILMFRNKHNQNEGSKQKIRKGVIFEVSFLIITFLFLFTTQLGCRWISSFNKEAVEYIFSKDTSIDEDVSSNVEFDSGSVSVRIIEVQTAFEKFLESPLLGQGLGYRWTAKGIDYGGSVIYMHNILAFIMMDLGLIGIIYILALSIWIIKILLVFLKRRNCDEILFLCISIIITAFTYANFFAVYRSIEFSVLLSLFFVIIAIEYKKVRNES